MADGVVPSWLSPQQSGLIEDHLAPGCARRSDGRTRADFDVAPTVMVAVGDDVEACRRPVKEMLALYVGGMGARDKNFYNRYARDLGYEAAAVAIQDLFLAGRKEEAVQAVPDAFVDEIALVGPLARIRERAGAWKRLGAEGKVGTLILGMRQPEHLDALAGILLG